jgi:hypothetical protein
MIFVFGSDLTSREDKKGKLFDMNVKLVADRERKSGK